MILAAALLYVAAGVWCALAWIEREDRAYYATAILPPMDGHRTAARIIGAAVVASLVVAFWPIYAWLRLRMRGKRTAAAR